MVRLFPRPGPAEGGETPWVHPAEKRLPDTSPADLFTFLTHNRPTRVEVDYLAIREIGLPEPRETIFAILEYFWRRG